ncbi:MAG: hypothetical protein ABW173_06795 [Sphingomonas sp.]
MTAGLVLMMQAAIAPGFDLARMPLLEPRCGATAGGDILVCARRTDDQAVGTVIPPTESLQRAETTIFGKVRAGVEASAKKFPGGVQSNRIMVTAKIPF